MKKLLSLIVVLSLALSAVTAFGAQNGYQKDEYVPSSDWKYEFSTQMGTSGPSMFDGDINTFWHSSYTYSNGQFTSKDAAPFDIITAFPEAKEISGIRYTPRQLASNSNAGIALKVEIYGSTDGKSFALIAQDSYDYGNGYGSREPKTTNFESKNLLAIKFRITEGVGGYGTCAELHFIKSNLNEDNADSNSKASSIFVKGDHYALADTVSLKGKPAPDALEYSSKWKIEVGSAFGNSFVANLFDCDKTTYWHSWYYFENGRITKKDEAPYDILVTFPYAKSIKGIRYTPRQVSSNDKSTSGIANSIEVYGSSDGINFNLLARDSYTYTDVNDRSTKTTTFQESEYKAILFRITYGVGGYGTGAELEFIKGSGQASDVAAKKVVTPKPAVKILESTIKAVGINPVGVVASDAYAYSSDWDIEANSAVNEANLAAFFDRNIQTMWHSGYKAEGTVVTQKDDPPFDIFVTFPENKVVSGVRYTPRQTTSGTSTTGIANKIEIYGSQDGMNYVKLAESTYTYGANYADRTPKTTIFDPVNVKTICYRILDGVGGNYATGAELEYLIGNASDAVNVTDYFESGTRNKGFIKLTIDKRTADVDGKEITLAAPAVISDGATLVPVRFVSEALGATVKWNAETKTVTINDKDTRIQLVIDSHRANVGNKYYSLVTPATIIGGCTMVPIRFVSEILGADVAWDDDARTVTIGYKYTIGCWGDSLAAGEGGVSWQCSSVLEKLAGVTVFNLGVNNEDPITIAVRNGAYDIVTTEDFEIPSSGNVSVNFKSKDGQNIVPRDNSGYWNPVYINGVEGTMFFEVDLSVSPRTLKSAVFKRTSSGAPIEVKAGTKIETAASLIKPEINIYSLGNYSTWKDNPYELVKIVGDMVLNGKNSTKYIVISPVNGTAEELAAVEAAFAASFGEHYFNLRKYMCSEALMKQEDIVMEGQDAEDFKAGRIPVSFVKSKYDRSSFNDLGYSCMAQGIYKKLIELGYVDK
ncbi:MAG: stalk domain-containing protein [Bacillota bacterium]|nr:stalk domain-containing protein [Bacillota bacterium]